MRFCIDRSIIGTDRHLVSNDGLFHWSDVVPSETYHLTGAIKDDSDWCLDTVIRLSCADVDLLPPKKFVVPVSALAPSLLGSGTVPWQKLMPAAAHRGFIERIIRDVVLATVPSILGYYRAVWVPGNAVLRSLRPVAVDRQGWQLLLDARVGNVPAVASFMPDESGFAQRVFYNRFGSLTGRLTVSSGPQILTLNREYKGKIMRSRWGKDGRVVLIDFAALEARVLLYEYGQKCDEVDLYGALAKELNQSRKAVKGAVISELYGSSKHALGKALGMEGKELNSFVKRVKAMFNTKQLLARVKEQFVATGYIVNRYGRRVKVDEPLDNIMVNYYAQSTGVDVSFLGFHQVVEQLQSASAGVVPVFLLHDSVIMDVHNDSMAAVQAIKHVKVPGYVQRYFLRFEVVS